MGARGGAAFAARSADSLRIGQSWLLRASLGEIAPYLGASRGVVCTADEVMIVSGTQQAMELIARLLLRPGDPVGWRTQATAELRQSLRSAPVTAVPVDGLGLDPAAGERICKKAKAAYVTPAHQFPLGITMPLDRRLGFLNWAARRGAYNSQQEKRLSTALAGR